MTQPNPLRATLTTDGKELAAAIMDAGANISMNQQLARDLAKLLVNSGDDTISAVKELVSQPDPKKLIKSVLRTKADESLEDWTTSDPEDFAHWIKSANLCFHAVSSLLRQLGEMRNVLTIHVVQGVRHYRESPENYTDAQMKDFALIAAAAEYAALQEKNHTIVPIGSRLNSTEQLSSIEGHDHFNCCSLSSQIVKEMVIKHPETIHDVIHVVSTNGSSVEAAISNYLDGGHGSLIDGAL